MEILQIEKRFINTKKSNSEEIKKAQGYKETINFVKQYEALDHREIGLVKSIIFCYLQHNPIFKAIQSVLMISLSWSVVGNSL